MGFTECNSKFYRKRRRLLQAGSGGVSGDGLTPHSVDPASSLPPSHLTGQQDSAPPPTCEKERHGESDTDKSDPSPPSETPASANEGSTVLDGNGGTLLSILLARSAERSCHRDQECSGSGAETHCGKQCTCTREPWSGDRAPGSSLGGGDPLTASSLPVCATGEGASCVGGEPSNNARGKMEVGKEKWSEVNDRGSDANSPHNQQEGNQQCSDSTSQSEDLLLGLCPEDLNATLNTTLCEPPWQPRAGALSTLPPASASGRGADGLHQFPPNTFYGLPMEVCECLERERGISSLYGTQDLVLCERVSLCMC